MAKIVVTCRKKDVKVNLPTFWKNALQNKEFPIGGDISLRIKCQPPEAFRNLLHVYPDLVQTVFVGNHEGADITVAISKWHSENRKGPLPGASSLATYTGGAAIGRLILGDTSWTVIDIFDSSKQVGAEDSYLTHCGNRAFFKIKILIPIEKWFRSWGFGDGRLVTGFVDFVSQLVSS